MRLTTSLFGITLALAGTAALAEVPLYLMTMPPLVIDSEGKRGMVGDVVLEAMRRAGIEVQVLVQPNPHALAMARDKPDTFIAAISRTPQRETAYTWIAPIIPIQRAFYTVGKRVDSFAEARRSLRHIAVSRNTANEEVLLREGFLRDQLVPVNAGESAPRMLLAGRVDGWFNLVPESETLLNQISAAGVVSGHPVSSSDLYLACARTCNAGLVRRIEAALAAMKVDGTTRKLMKRYAAEPGFALDQP
jgi:polar amino acid transport system substrate-binding protein